MFSSIKPINLKKKKAKKDAKRIKRLKSLGKSSARLDPSSKKMGSKNNPKAIKVPQKTEIEDPYGRPPD